MNKVWHFLIKTYYQAVFKHKTFDGSYRYIEFEFECLIIVKVKDIAGLFFLKIVNFNIDVNNVLFECYRILYIFPSSLKAKQIQLKRALF